MSGNKKLIGILVLGYSLPLVAHGSHDECADRDAAYKFRVERAKAQTHCQPCYDIEKEHNGDECAVADFAGAFSKSLEHDCKTGILTNNGKKNYKRLLHAIESGEQADYNAIQLSPESVRGFVSPQAAVRRSLEGCDSASIPMPSAPKLSSHQAAAQLAEVYLEAICRDVEFEDFGTGERTDRDSSGCSITKKAATVLNAFGKAFKGPRNEAGKITPATLFRGRGQGELIGPFVSQLLFFPYRRLFYPGLEHPAYIPVAGKREFGVTWSDFVAIQNGVVPRNYEDTDFDYEHARHFSTVRDLGTLAHYDGPFEEYYDAVNILLSHGFPLAKGIPYTKAQMPNEVPFVNFGAPDIFSAVGLASLEGFKHAWAHKWRANRFLRPEAMAGLVHRAKVTGENPYNIHESLFGLLGGIDLLAWVLEHNKIQASTLIPESQRLTKKEACTYLLSQMYPEASPIHSSYPSGHATTAGACITIIKALFDDKVKISDHVTPVKPDPNNQSALVPLSGEGEDLMTVGSELNKLASNIATGRNIAGIHYRADADEGIKLGEAAAICLLQDWAATYEEELFEGFELTKFDGTRIHITAHGVKVVGESCGCHKVVDGDESE